MPRSLTVVSKIVYVALEESPGKRKGIFPRII